MTRTELERVFCRWIYFHLRSKIFFWPSYEGQSPRSEVKPTALPSLLTPTHNFRQVTHTHTNSHSKVMWFISYNGKGPMDGRIGMTALPSSLMPSMTVAVRIVRIRDYASAGRSGSASYCSVRGPTFESHHGCVYYDSHSDMQLGARAAHPYCSAEVDSTLAAMPAAVLILPIIFWRCIQMSIAFTARCYASAVLAMAMCPSVCLSVCLSICHKSVFY